MSTNSPYLSVRGDTTPQAAARGRMPMSPAQRTALRVLVAASTGLCDGDIASVVGTTRRTVQRYRRAHEAAT